MTNGKIVNNFYCMPCGCRFPILNEKKRDLGDGIPPIEIDYYNIRLDCPLVYKLFASGKTLGVFQLEKSLGQGWSKRLQPVNENEISDLIAAIRPGTLKSKAENSEGKMISMTKHLVDRKHLREEFEPIHESIKDITEPTYSVIVYQEQAMRIAQRIAGFNLQQADQLRKAMGKKDAALMAKVRIEFLEGCKKAGIVSDEKANEIFDIIEKSNRYAFNLSHSISYSMLSYCSAYAKAHFPKIFFDSYLYNSDNKADWKEEVNSLVNDGKYFGMNFSAPTILSPKENFDVFDCTISFGLGNISGVGEKYVNTIREKIKLAEQELNKKIQDMTWFEILVFLSTQIKSNVIKNIISVGGFSHLCMYRKYMLFELNKFETLTDREIVWIKNHSKNISNLENAIESLLEQKEVKITARREEKLLDVLKTIKNPPNELKDCEEWISNAEKNLLGTEITCSKLDVCNTSMGNCKCSEFDKADFKEFRIAATISSLSEYRPKDGSLKGKTMAYITLADSSGSCEAVVFPNKYEELNFLLFSGNTVCVVGKKTNSGSLQINNVTQI